MTRLAYGIAVAACSFAGAALLSTPVAAADVFDASSYTLDPVAPETVTSFYNLITAPPGINESLQGYGAFDVLSDGSDDPVGHFYAYVSTAPFLTPHLGNLEDAVVNSQVLYVSPDVPGYEDPTGIAPVAGSVISTTQSFGGLFENVYSAIPSGDGTSAITDILKTPFGDIDLSQLVNALGFDAANVPSVLPDEITALSDPVYTAVNGLPPLTIALQGYQAFQFGDNPDATFNAVQTTTTDGIGFHTEAFLVTEETGTAASLPVGSIYNTIDFANLSNVYSSIPQADGTDEVTNILINTNTGQTFDLSWLFADADASAGLNDGSFVQPISFGDQIIQLAPDSDLTFTGINGLPPGNVSIQADAIFGLFDEGLDDPSSTFGADLTVIQTMFLSNYTESLLITDSIIPELPEGSIIDFTNYGFGFENLYMDLPGLGADGENLITDTFSTPLGAIDLSWLYAMLDASAGLNPSEGLVTFADAPWLELFETIFDL
jgi:hypothetical protein